jgi:plasmid stabilization system protein ParE
VVLEAHPLIGSRARGYVALYRYVEAVELVVILAIRAQRERVVRAGLAAVEK